MFSAASKTGSQPAVAANYIEDVFSTWLYTGNNTGQTITNGIDLSTNGGLVWVKWRSGAIGSGTHVLVDTSRGANKFISSNTTSEEITQDTVSAFNTNGFNLTGNGGGKTNYIGDLYASWTFREQPKFFDIVTYTGDGTTNRQIAHNLGSAPGMIIVKRTDAAAGWCIYHRTQPDGFSAFFDTDPFQEYGIFGSNASQTSSVFQLGASNLFFCNASGGTYVAYLFAHNAGGFGLSGTDNVISCGSFTTNSSGIASPVTLGYEPQWVLIKRTNDVDNWYMSDNMRGLAVSGNQPNLLPDNSIQEIAGGYNAYPNATGFTPSVGIGSSTFIYMAIRRGPMKVPTTGTSVFAPVLQSSSLSTGTPLTTGFPIDSQWQYYRTSTSANNTSFVDRLRGVSTNSTAFGRRLVSSNTAAEVTGDPATLNFNNTGFQVPSWWQGVSMAYYNFRRAPGFFDEVCYTGTGVDFQFVNHNLGVPPELIIVKSRSASSTNWRSFATQEPLGSDYNGLRLNTTGAASGNATSASFSSTTFLAFSNSALGLPSADNQTGNGVTYVAYLFATCPGVSKVGNYTGNGSTQAIACGFTGGARFVLIKRTDSTGDWYVYDTARGMTVLTDPYLLLNETAAEVATLGSVTTTTGGFTVNASILAAINTNAASYIFLAIA
jgi:hypothetical protein